jgi:hypothetical protein
MWKFMGWIVAMAILAIAIWGLALAGSAYKC